MDPHKAHPKRGSELEGMINENRIWNCRSPLPLFVPFFFLVNHGLEVRMQRWRRLLPYHVLPWKPAIGVMIWRQWEFLPHHMLLVTSADLHISLTPHSTDGGTFLFLCLFHHLTCDVLVHGWTSHKTTQVLGWSNAEVQWLREGHMAEDQSQGSQ